MQGRTLQGRTGQGRTGQGRTGQGRTGQGRTGQGRTGQGRTGQGQSITGSSDVPALLAALNGVQLLSSDGVSSVRLDANGSRLVNAAGIAVSGQLIAITRDGQRLSITAQPGAERGGLVAYDVAVGGTPVCATDEHGAFVTGSWDERGALRPGQAVTFACDSGVIAKCARWGYVPERVGSELHETCTRLARADYCGDGESHTLDGTLINVYDRLQIQQSDPSSKLSFEAAWGPSGAACVNEPRYRLQDAVGAPVLPACWAALPHCGSFEEGAARKALLGNDSEHRDLPLDAMHD